MSANRRRTYNEEGGEDMGRYITYYNYIQGGGYYFACYDIKENSSNVFNPSNNYSTITTRYKDTLYITSLLMVNSYEVSRDPQVGDNLITYVESTYTYANRDTAQMITHILDNGEYVGKSYNTLIDSDTGQLYAIVGCEYDSSHEYAILKLNSSLNITSIAYIDSYATLSNIVSVNSGILYKFNANKRGYDSSNNLVYYDILESVDLNTGAITELSKHPSSTNTFHWNLS